MARKNNQQDEEKGRMSVNEAGHRGGEATSESHGREFYEGIGHEGGQRTRELINEGKEAEHNNSSKRSERD